MSPCTRGDDRARHAAERARDAGDRRAAGTRAADAPAGAATRAATPTSTAPAMRSRSVAHPASIGTAIACVTRGPASRRRCLRARTRDACSAGARRPWARSGRRSSLGEVRPDRPRERERGGRGSGGAPATSSASTADTSHVATWSGGTVSGAGVHGRRLPAKRSRTTSVPAARSPRRWSCCGRDDRDRCRRDRRPGGSRRCAAMLRIALARKSTGSPFGPTTRMPGAPLAERAPVVRALRTARRTRTRRGRPRIDDARDREPGCRCCEHEPPSDECDDDRELDHACRGGGR